MDEAIVISETIVAQEEPIVREERYDLVEEARILWESLDDFRERRMRSRDYYRGRPNEKFIDPDTNEVKTEREHIIEQGRIPFGMNLVAPVVRNIKGQFRTNKTQRIAFPRNRDDNDAGDMMSEALRYVCDLNRTDEVDAGLIVESCMSGAFGWKMGWKPNSDLDRDEICVDPIDNMRIFFNRDLRDTRMKELRVIGEIHDLPIDEIISAFAKSKYDEQYLRERYAGISDQIMTQTESGFDAVNSINFAQPVDPSMARVIEVWKKEFRWVQKVRDRVTGSWEQSDMTEQEIRELNQRRILEAMALGQPMPPMIETTREYKGVWRCYFLSPIGDVLFESDTPYWHESHPYVMGMASFVDGEIWGMIEDIIDPQRLVNRITIGIDFMFGASAKGVLLIPEDALPEKTTLEQFASEWSKFNGVIKFRAKPNVPLPQQITQAAIPAGIFQWLGTMQQQIKDISGVQGASQGQEPTSGTAASLYHQQVMQAQVTVRDFFDSFYDARKQRELKIMKLVGQYYDEPKYIATAGKRIDGSRYIAYDPERVRNIDFDLAVSDTPDTAAVRQLTEEYLTNFLTENRLTFQQYLRLSSHPKADMIMRVIDQMNPLLKQQQITPDGAAMLPGGPAGLLGAGQVGPKQQQMMQLQQAAQNGDRDAMALLSQAQ